MKKFIKGFFKAFIAIICVFVVLIGLKITFDRFVYNKDEQKDGVTYLSPRSEALALNKQIEKANLRSGHYDVLKIDQKDVNIKVDAGWFVLKNGKVTDFAYYYINAEKEIPESTEDVKYEKATDFYTNCYVSRINNEMIYEKIYYTNLVNVKDYGAVGDGITDDTEAIKKATNVINETGGVLYFPYSTYYVSVSGDLIKHGAEKSTIIKITTDKDVIVDFCYSTIQLAGSNYPNSRIVYPYNNSGYVSIRNGVLKGDRLTHNYKPVLNSKGEISGAQGSVSHCFGHGIFIQNTRNGHIFNMDIYEMTGDAIVVKNGKIAQDSGLEYRTLIEDSKLHHCRRQGITIGDSDITYVKDTEIYKIGHVAEYTNDNCLYDDGSEVNAVKGSLPMAGVDVEPDSGSFLARDVTFDGVNIHTCTSYGIVGNKSSRVDQGLIDGVTVKNSYVETYALDYATIDNTDLVVISEEDSKVATLLRKCTITNSRLIKEYPYYEIFYFNECEIINSEFKSVKEDETTTGVFMFEPNNTVIGCTFTNLRGTGAGYTSYKGFGVTLYNENSFNENSKDNTFRNCDIMIRDPHNIQKTKFYNCTISIGYPTGAQNPSVENPSVCKFTDCLFDNVKTDRYISHITAIILTNCKLFGLTDYLFGTIPRTFINCYLEFNDMSARENGNYPFMVVSNYSLKPPILDGCEIRVKGEIKDSKHYKNKNAFGASYFKNNTKIYLELYNDNVKLAIPNKNMATAHGMSTDESEYSVIVYYNGSQSLNG